MTDVAQNGSEIAQGVAVTLNGRVIDAVPGELVIEAAERAGVYIPRFCHHPRMQPVGMCRMCIVEIDTGRGPALLPSCMITVSEGMVIETESPVTRKAQDGVLEFLLVNHPLDCPVCDKGGECPLQDQTVAFGPGESRFVEEKRHHEKPIAISDVVLLDRERCILCDRCTRFARTVAGDPLISFVNRGNETEVNTFPDHPFASYFSGNTVQICPVGALTATPYRFKARPWDLDQVESTCTSCSVGCRVGVESSSNQLVRCLGVDIDAVNWGWLCDKGRFDFEAVNSAHRLTRPLARKGDDLVEVSWADALTEAASALGGARERHGPSSIAVVGGARLTNEEAYAWSKFARGVLGTDSLDAQLGDGLPADVVLGLPRATIDEACSAATLVLVGPDLKEELPILYLRLRDAVVNRGLKVIEISASATSMTRYAEVSLRYRPGEAAVLVQDLFAHSGDVDVQADLTRARSLLRAGEVVCVLGRPSVAERADSIVQAALRLHREVPGARFLSALRRANVHGAIDMGLTPGMLPGRISLEEGREAFTEAWGELPASTGLDTAGVLQAAAEGRIQALVLLGADPLADFPDRDLARRGIAGAGFVLAVDCFGTASVRQADVVLPAAAYAEKSGTTTNIEGRVSRLHRKVTAPGTSRPDWMIACDLAERLGADLGFESTEAILDEIERLAPSHAGLTTERLASSEGLEGIVATRRAAGVESVLDATAGSTLPVDGYSLRLVSGRKLYDNGTIVQHSSSLAPLAPGGVARMNPADLDRLGVATDDRVRVASSRGAVVVPALADPGVARGTVALAFNQAGAGAADLIDASLPVTEVRIETLGQGGREVSE